jgi:hypothetical protein
VNVTQSARRISLELFCHDAQNLLFMEECRFKRPGAIRGTCRPGHSIIDSTLHNFLSGSQYQYVHNPVQSARMAEPTPVDDLFQTYRPYIADCPPTAFGEPFPSPPADGRSDAEVNATLRALRRRVHCDNFSPAIPLADFCLIADERWAADDSAMCHPTSCRVL